MTEHNHADADRTETKSVAKLEYDSVYVNSLRETGVLLIGFVVFLGWTIGSSMLMGYGTDVEIVSRRTMGMPSWVFWSVLIPWGAATLFTFWFAWFFMANDSLTSESVASSTQTGTLSEQTPHE